MDLKYYDCTFIGVLHSDVCNRIIEYGLSKPLARAEVGNSDKENTVRDSDVVWLFDSWIYDLLQPYVAQANKVSEWNFQYESADGIQFTKYGVGQYYDWHKDTEILKSQFDGLPHEGQIRKLSITVNLNDDYEGGEFYIDASNTYGQTTPTLVEGLKTEGSIVVFPSDVWHKVDKVTKGTRYSLVVWLNGEPWK